MTDQEYWLFVDDSLFLRHLLFWLAIFLGIPLGVFLCRLFRVGMGIVFILMLWSVCEPNSLGISFETREFYRTAVRGFEVFGTDILAVILFFSMLWRYDEFRPRLWVPLTIPYFVFLILAVVSWAFAADYLTVPPVRKLLTITATPPDYQYFETSLYPLFEIFRHLRTFFVFWVTVNFVRGERELKALCWGAAITILYLTGYSLYQRYLLGEYRVFVGLGHPNDLAVFIGMLGAIIVPLIFQKKDTLTSLFFGFCVVCVLAVEILCVSRSGLFIFGAGMVVTGLYCLKRYLCTRNLILVSLGVLASLAVLARGRDTLIARFVYQADIRRSLDERVLFNQVAILMAQEHPLGVGLGNFSAWSWERYAALVWDDLEPGVPAHNIWYLTLGEAGWLGVALLVALWLRICQIAWSSLWSSKSEMSYAILLGICFSLATMHLHSLLHHSYRSTSVFYLTMILVGVMVGYYYTDKNRSLESMPK